MSERAAQDWPQLFASLAESSRDPRLRAYYGAGCVTADTPLAEVPLVALDVETTGLDPREHAIVSLGLVPLNLQRIRCSEARYWVVKPAGELSAESVTFHHITHSDIRHAPRLASVLDELLEALAGKVVVAHYRHIERSFLDQALRRHLGEGLIFPIIDTMELEARLHPKRRVSWWNRLRGRRPLSIRLADSRLRYGLPLYSAHHALTDALACGELLQAQVAKHYPAHTPVGALWELSPRPPWRSEFAMRGLLLLLLFTIPPVIALSLEASNTVTLIAAAPLLVTSFVQRMGRPQQLSPMAIGAMGVLVVACALVFLLLWYVLVPRS